MKTTTTNEVPAHIQRVIDEREQLQDRKTKLGAFFGTTLFAGLATDEQTDMREQHGHMEAYHQVLDRRLSRAGFGNTGA